MNKPDLFAIASDNYRNEILGLQKYGSYKTNKKIVINLNAEFGHKKVSEITKQDIQRYIVKLHGKISVDYLRHHLSVFKGIMEYADDDWVMPRVKVPKKTKTLQKFYSFEEVRTLLNSSSGMLHLLIMFLAETGCRIGEALAVKEEDIGDHTIDISKNVYEGVVQPTPKTDSSIRKIYISDKLWLAVKDKHKYLFQSATGRPAWPQQLTYEMRELCVKAGLEWKGFHAFRRGNVTELINVLGMPERIVGYRVGHESEGMTLGVYTMTRFGCDKIWIDKISQLLYEGTWI